MYFIIFIVLLLLFISLLLLRTANFKSHNQIIEGEPVNCENRGFNGVEKLSEAIKIKTISSIDYEKVDWDEFQKYHKKMEELFPLVHENLEKTVINGYSLVFHWKGKDSSKKPYLIMAHMDVVPVEAGTEKDWKYDAFSGAIEEGCVWGRGALDIKIHMISALEACEVSLKEGFMPDRDIYFAFGHDEEVGGSQGASQIVEYFKEKGVEFDLLLDEGGCITKGVLAGVDKPIALIGIGEKGYANIKITVEGAGGHSSTPPPSSSLGLLAKVITNLEKKQCKLTLIKPIEEFLMKIGPEMGFVNKLILSNLWLFKPVFLKIFAKTKNGNALLRTTTAVTMANASMQPNVLPQKASTIANFRILQGETGQDLIEHIKDVNKGINIDIEPLRLENPSAISPTDSAAYSVIEKNIKRIYSDAIVAPYLMLAGSDSRKYEPVCKNIYRFTPYLINNSELSKIHNTNENISCENVDRCTAFFYEIYRA